MKTETIYIFAGLILFVNLAFIICYIWTTREGYDSANQPIPKDASGNYIDIPNGYYKVSEGVMAPIPFGYAASIDKTSIYPISQAAIREGRAIKETTDKGFAGGYAGSGRLAHDICFNQMNYAGAPTEASYNQLIRFNTDNYNVQYHDSVDTIAAANNSYDVSFGTVWVIDRSGNKVAMPYSPVQGNITYYTPGSYRFGASNYVPTYEDSVYLSSTAGGIINSSTHPSLTYKNKNKGICELYEHLPEALEEKCNSLSADVCASTNCCVYLGGAKCVSGNKQGPYVKANYSDVFVKNKDYYFYKGKCFGNC